MFPASSGGGLDRLLPASLMFLVWDQTPTPVLCTLTLHHPTSVKKNNQSLAVVFSPAMGHRLINSFSRFLHVCIVGRGRLTGELMKLKLQGCSLARPLPRPCAQWDIHNFLFFYKESSFNCMSFILQKT